MIVEFGLLAIMLACCFGGGLWLGYDVGKRHGAAIGAALARELARRNPDPYVDVDGPHGADSAPERP